MNLSKLLLLNFLTLACFNADGRMFNREQHSQKLVDEVSQVHIALAGIDGDSMTVSWSTPGDIRGVSSVRYGTSPGDLSITAFGTASSYLESYHHHVKLAELKPSTQYYYICGTYNDDGSFSSLSEEKSFTSAPAMESVKGDENWNFFAFGDLGLVNGEPTADYINNVIHNNANVEGNDKPQLVWHSGDVGYADDSFIHYGCYTKFCYEEKYDEYMARAQDAWASSLPYMVAPGNHEADCHSPACLASKERRENLSNFTAYNARFRMPSEESNGTLNMWYSFNYNNVHFVTIDTETAYPGAPEEKRYVLPCGGFGDMLTWLEQDLAQANLPEVRQKRPWIMVAGHRPIYESTNDSMNAALQVAIEDLLYKYGVDVYLAGHRHYYTRYYPLYRGKQDPAGYDYPRYTTHLTIGGPGNDEVENIQRRLKEAEDVVRDVHAGVVRPSDPSPHEDSDGGIAERERERLMHLTGEERDIITAMAIRERGRGSGGSSSSTDGNGEEGGRREGGEGGWMSKAADFSDRVRGVLLPEDPDNFSSNAPPSSWVALWDKDNHVGVIRVYVQGRDSMRIDYIRTMTGEIYDSVLLRRDDTSRGTDPDS